MTVSEKQFYVIKIHGMYFVDGYEDKEIEGLGLTLTHELRHAHLFDDKNKAHKIAKKCDGKINKIIEMETKQ